MAESLVERLQKRAEIRRGIPRSERDRIADLLEEAATTIEALIEGQAKMARMILALGEDKKELARELSDARESADYWIGEYHSAMVME